MGRSHGNIIISDDAILQAAHILQGQQQANGGQAQGAGNTIIVNNYVIDKDNYVDRKEDPGTRSEMDAAADRMASVMNGLAQILGDSFKQGDKWREWQEYVGRTMAGDVSPTHYTHGQREVDGIERAARMLSALENREHFDSYVSGMLKEIRGVGRTGGFAVTGTLQERAVSIERQAKELKSEKDASVFAAKASDVLDRVENLQSKVSHGLSLTGKQYSDARDKYLANQEARRAAKEAKREEQKQQPQTQQSPQTQQAKDVNIKAKGKTNVDTGGKPITSNAQTEQSERPAKKAKETREVQRAADNAAKQAESQAQAPASKKKAHDQAEQVGKALGGALREADYGGGKVGGGHPGGKGGGGGDGGGTPPAISFNGGGKDPNGGVQVFKSLADLNKALADRGLNGISRDIENKLTDLNKGIEGATKPFEAQNIRAAFDKNGMLTGVSLQAVNPRYGRALAATLNYTSHTKDGEQVWTTSTSTRGDIPKFQAAEEKLQKDITSLETQMNTALQNPIVKASNAQGENVLRHQLLSLLGQGGVFGKYAYDQQAGGKITLDREKLDTTQLKTLQENFGDFQNALKDINGMMSKKWANNSVDKMESNVQEMLGTRTKLAVRLNQLGYQNAATNDAMLRDGQTKVSDLFKNINAAYDAYTKAQGDPKAQMHAYNDLFKAVTTAQRAVAVENTQFASASQASRAQLRVQDVVNAAYKAMGVDGAKSTAVYGRMDGAIASAQQAKDPIAQNEALHNLRQTTKELTEATASYNATQKQERQRQNKLEKSDYYGQVSQGTREKMHEAAAQYKQTGSAEDLTKYQAAMDRVNWREMAAQLKDYNAQVDLLRNPTGKADQSGNWAESQKQQLTELMNLQQQFTTMAKSGDLTGAQSVMGQMKTGITELKDSLKVREALMKDVEKLQGSKGYTSASDAAKQQLQDALQAYNTAPMDKMQQAANGVREAMSAMNQEISQMGKQDAIEKQAAALTAFEAKLQGTLLGKGGGFGKWTPEQQQMFGQVVQHYQAAMTANNDQNQNPAGAAKELGLAQKNLTALNAMLNNTGIIARGAGTQVDALTQSLLNISSPIMMWRRFTSYFKKAAQNVAAIDKQMADLKKVTSNTDAEYDQFLTSTGKNAVAIGSSISDLVATTSTFAHMGYSLTQSQALGVTATKFANVGNFSNMTDAADAMIAVIKGFDGLEIDDAGIVGDKLTAVANNYAVTANDIAEGLQKSASALNVAGNDVDQSTAMITAIAEVTRDAGAAGSALKVLSMRIRGAKTE